jgi:signal peptidase I
VAFVLAFLFRTFEAEAFVIPTGSMAPTLMGRHKDLQCPQCKYWYQASASEEVDPNTNAEKGSDHKVVGCICPMCRFPMNLGPGGSVSRRHRSFKGDRILVGKFCYELSDPERWDVAVFKYPGGAKTNFIKRLVGLPGETIRIHHGDIFVKRDNRRFTIARKQRPEKLLAMLQPVYDNDYVLPKMVRAGWPARWQPWLSTQRSPDGAWKASKDYRSFRTDGSAPGRAWLRYQHIVPSPYQWKSLDKGALAPDAPARRQLISDFCAYNTSWAFGEGRPAPDSAGLHWVGDLAVQCELEVLEPPSESSQAVFELVEGGWRMQCRINVATGKATLAIHHEDPNRGTAQTIDGKDYRPTAQTAVRGPRKKAYKIIFANCDDELRLWVDGSLVEFKGETAYEPLGNTRPEETFLFPVGLEHGQELDEGVISGELRLRFQSQGISLSGNAVVAMVEQRRGWLITDQTDEYFREYTVRRVGSGLQVFAPADLAPAGIGSDGAALRVSHLKVLRDIYYIAENPNRFQGNEPLTDFGQIPPRLILSDATTWGKFKKMQPVDFVLERFPSRPQGDQFLALGDNSPKSKDSRLWEREGFEHYVERRLLVGKALYIYWPHSWDELPGTEVPFPLFPNVARMGFIR